MTLRTRPAILGLICAAELFACSAARGADEAFKIRISPVFITPTPAPGPAAMVVDVSGIGVATHGMLNVSFGQSAVGYTIDIPARGIASRIVVPPVEMISVGIRETAKVTLQTPLGRASEELVLHDPAQNTPPPSESGVLVYISTESVAPALPPGPEVTRPSGAVVQGFVGPLTLAHPTRLPDRASLYTASAVILGPGAQSMTDREAAALREWTLAGGQLLFVVGRSADAMNDPRWKSILPVSGASGPSRSISLAPTASRQVEDVGPIPVPGVTLQAGTRTTEIEGSVVSASREFGLGSVVFLAVDPFSSPLKDWSGDERLFVRLVNPMGGYQAMQLARVSRDGGPGKSASDGQTDPFDFKLPSGNSVMSILIAFFVFAIPVNFLVLRKLKRSELAWVTAPVISLAFAGIFFVSARKLYDVGLIRATRGVLVMQSGEPRARFSGRTDLYFPQSGIVDLKMRGVESVEEISSDHGEMGQVATGNAGLSLTDDGEVRLDRVPTRNLSFRTLDYVQSVRAPDVYLTETPIRMNRAKCTISNRYAVTLVDVRLFALGHEAVLGNLAPGSARDVEISTSVNPPAAQKSDASPTLADFTARNGIVALRASLDSSAFGPRIGQESKAHGDVALVCVAARSPR